ncbi:MAG: hypothetical protein IJL07_02135 [Lachnospiraceae bacterium]|nr:hypothetical protein [Lachnospiraceae bacterium]
MGENVLIIDALPAGEVSCPPYKLTPYKEGDNGFEKLCIVFEEDYDGDLSIKIFSLMAEDFHVWIDGEEYSYAIRGGKQTDPGYAMLAGPFEKGTVIGAAWGKESASVYMQEDVNPTPQPELVSEETDRSVKIPFVITGAQSVLVSNTFKTVLVETAQDSTVTLASHRGVKLLTGGTPIEGETILRAPADAVYSGLEVEVLKPQTSTTENDLSEKDRLIGETYRIAVRNPRTGTEQEQGPDAFMNVTGSFAGELCYKVGASEDGSKGTYHTHPVQGFGIDPFTGYYWGRTADNGSAWAFQLEEGLYGINVSVGSGVEAVVLVTHDKEKEYKLPEAIAMSNGPTAMTIRARVDNGITILKSRGSDGAECPFESIEIRTLSTTAHASDYVPADMSEEPEVIPTEVEEEVVSTEEPAVEEVTETVAAEDVTEETVAEQEAVPTELQEEAPTDVDEELPVEAETESENTVDKTTDNTVVETIVEVAIEREEAVVAEKVAETDTETPKTVEYRTTSEIPAVQVNVTRPQKEYSTDRSIELTEKEYRSAIENYFGPTSHGIDFWDSERKERPAPEVRSEPEIQPKEILEENIVPELKPEDNSESEVKSEEQQGEEIAEQEPEVKSEEEQEEVISEPEPEVKSEEEPEKQEEVIAEPKPEVELEKISESTVETEDETEAQTESTEQETPVEEPAKQIRVSVYSGSSRKQTSKYTSKDKPAGLSGLFSVFGKKKR